MNINLFVYYGVITNIDDISKFMNQLGEDNIYNFIMSRDLQYKNINSNKSSVVIGKEIFWDFEFNMFKLDLKENGIVKIGSRLGEDIVINTEEELVKSKLIQIGIFDQPEYYVFANYGESI